LIYLFQPGVKVTLTERSTKSSSE